jgi:hypothetical protein
MTKLLTLAVLLGGCMKIYPSTELPDLDVEWYTDDCTSPEVAVTLVGLDDGSVTEHIFPCEDMRATIEDLDRALYRVDGSVLGPDGTIEMTSSQEADLRNGIDENVYLYFAGSSYLRITWDFADGASCESLDADTVDLDFFDPDYGIYTMSTACGFGVFVGYPFGNGLTVQLRAVSRRKTVAVSARTDTIDIMPPEELLLGPLTLVPCANDCPD